MELSISEHVHCIMGNHDLMILNHLLKTHKINFEKLKTLNSHVLEKHNNLPQYIDFLSKLSYYLILDDFILVHAGINFQHPRPFEDWEDMLTIVGFSYNKKLANNKTIIHGHLPQKLETIKKSIAQNSKIIGLDNGCVYKGEREGHGNLLCYDLDSKELVIQEKLD